MKPAAWVCTLGLGVTLWAGCDEPSPSEVGEPETTATFELTFDGTWSQVTHPMSFPSLPHFSGLIGATHQGGYVMWEAGQLASTGIKDMAELGSKSALTGEVEAAIQAGRAGTVVSGSGIGRSPGTATVEFEVSSRFPLLSLTSMIAPSPDWFVGVAGLDLMPGGEWIDSVTVALPPYDAGTDSGSVYASGNSPTVPPAPIRLLTDTPFDANSPPLGTFRIVRR